MGRNFSEILHVKKCVVNCGSSAAQICRFQVEMGRYITQTHKPKKVEIHLHIQPPCTVSFRYLAIKQGKNRAAGLLNPVVLKEFPHLSPNN